MRHLLDGIREKIEQLTASLTAIENYKEEVSQMQTVNFKKYADIIVRAQRIGKAPVNFIVNAGNLLYN